MSLKVEMLIPTVLYSHLEFFNGYPTVGREVLKHRHKPLKAAIPVANQKHQRHEVKDAHKLPSHCQKLKFTTRSRQFTPASQLPLNSTKGVVSLLGASYTCVES